MATNRVRYVYINTQVTGDTLLDLHQKAAAETDRLTAGIPSDNVSWSYSGVSGRDANGITGTPGDVVDYVALIQISASIE